MTLLARTAPLAATFLFLIPGCGRRAPEVEFVYPEKRTIVSAVETNGRIEAVDRTVIAAPRAGRVAKVFVRRGDRLSAGAVLVELETGADRSALAAAEARVAEAEAALELLRRGGPAGQRAALEAELETARAELEFARSELAALERLEARQAVAGAETERARERLQTAELRVRGLEKRLGALVSPAEIEQAEARLAAARAEAAAIRRRIDLASIRTPAAGTLYQFELRRGDYVGQGSVIGEVGDLSRLQAIVYVDEPDLGRVKLDLPVVLTWDALPGREWRGSVARLPTEIVAYGTRQVGEVLVELEESVEGLPPGANVNAVIRTAVARDALALPRQALVRRGSETGVWVLEGDVVRWRPVETGVSSVTEAEIVAGLKAGEAVALPGGTPLRDGLRVRPRFR